MKKQLSPLMQKILHRIAAVLAAVVLGAVFYLAVVLGQPEESDKTAPLQEQPLLAASPAIQLTAAEELPQLTAAFPVPVLSFLPGAGPQLNAGMSYDAAFENGFARILDLRYILSSGGTVQVQSIYPARALSLLSREGYTLRTASSQSLAGLQAVRMDSASGVRFHAQSDQALYVVTLPRMEDEALSATLKALQLSAAQ